MPIASPRRSASWRARHAAGLCSRASPRTRKSWTRPTASPWPTRRTSRPTATRATGLLGDTPGRTSRSRRAGLPPSTALWPLPAVSLVAEERTLKGSYIGTCVPSRDIPRYIDLYLQGRLPVNKLLTGRLKLDEINHGFDMLHEGKAIRQVVVFA